MTAPAASRRPAAGHGPRLRSSARTPRGGPSVTDGPTARASTTYSGALDSTSAGTPYVAIPEPRGRRAGDVVEREPARGKRYVRHPLDGGREGVAAVASSGRRQHDEAGDPEATDEEQEGLARRVVRPLEVLDDDRPGCRHDERHEDRRDGVEEPARRRLVVEPASLARSEGGDLRRQGDDRLVQAGGTLPARPRRPVCEAGPGSSTIGA
jgi:hypothetical protein